MTTQPPEHIVASALAYARQSPCAKSKRGVAIFDPTTPHAAAIALGTNHPPLPQGCDGSDACRKDCGRRCIHAEADGLWMFAAMYGASSALHQLGLGNGLRVHPKSSELVHVKIGDAGELVAGGGPSCWQCSRNVIEVGIAAVWLYQLETVTEVADHVVATEEIVHARGRWHRYTGEEFHRVTCQNAKGGAVYLCP